MERMDLRARAFAWFTRPQSSAAAITEDQVIAMKSREFRTLTCLLALEARGPQQFPPRRRRCGRGRPCSLRLEQ